MVVITEVQINEGTVKFTGDVSDTHLENTISSRTVDVIDEEMDCDENKSNDENSDGEETDGEDEEVGNVDSDSDVDDSENDTSDADQEDDDSEQSFEENHSEEEEESHDAAEEEKPSGMDIVREILAKASKEAEKNESIAVSKPLDLEYDLGTLLAVDTNELDFDALGKSPDDYLKSLARDNTQLLINHIWQLPITRKGLDIVARLPPPTSKLPREKPIPKRKEKTKWETFAQEKGIRKQRKGNKVWDEVLEKWVPRWGYLKVKAEKEREWVIENKKSEDPMQDPFAKKKVEKQERVAKNELQRMRNIARSRNVKIPRGDKMDYTNQKQKGEKVSKQKRKGKGEIIPRMGLLTPDKLNSYELKQALTISRASTASLGKFQTRLPKEKDGRNVTQLMPMAKKRKHPMLKPEVERKMYLQTIEGVLKKKPKLDLDKAVNRQINQEERQRAAEKAEKPSGKGRGKAKGARKGTPKGKGLGKAKLGSKGSKGGGKKKSGGRKRR